MNKVLIAILAAALTCCVALAQDTPAPQEQQAPAAAPSSQPAPEPSTSQPQSQQQPPEPQQTPQTQQAPAARQPAQAQTPGQSTGTRKIAPGSVIPVELTKSVDAKKAKTGDEVVAKVTQDMKTSSGDVLVPKDTKVVGHVTEAQARNNEQKESQVGIAFDRAVMKDGSEVQLPMSIQAIIAPPNANPSGGGGYDQPAAAPTGNSGGGRPSMGQSAPSKAPSPSAGSAPSDAQSGAGAHEPITGNTQGVVGISNLKLSAAPDATQGSVVTSEKNNVKLDRGTLMLLRVNQ